MYPYYGYRRAEPGQGRLLYFGAIFIGLGLCAVVNGYGTLGWPLLVAGGFGFAFGLAAGNDAERHRGRRR
jgi:hypothetical protein